MYELEGLKDIFFIMLYGGSTLIAVFSCSYLLFTRGNLFLASIHPPKALRRWTAAFLASVAASHVWWSLLGIYWLVDDRLLRNIVAITLDRLTFVPLMMCVLLRLLQDRKRSLWPVWVAMIPVAVMAVNCIVTRNQAFESYLEFYSFLIGIAFAVYYVRAIHQYGRWLHDNYADLEHKEIWQSLLLMAFILFVYMAYATNAGALLTEYLAQVNTLIIIVFILWRVETLQQLDNNTEDMVADGNDETDQTSAPNDIGALLVRHCELPQLYLRHDLTLQQLAVCIGTNRTYLSSYFAEHDMTYNAYINRLRIEHFMSLYSKARKSSLPIIAKDLAAQSGYSSYMTFGAAFKRYTGSTVTAWMNQQEDEE